MLTTCRQTVAAGCAALLLAAAAFAASAPAASAGTGWNYISLPTWLGNCPYGGSVKYLSVTVGNTWSGGDWGDDLVYARVNLYQSQRVTARGLCNAAGWQYWGPWSYQTIYPTRQNQTWWVGPRGVSRN